MTIEPKQASLAEVQEAAREIIADVERCEFIDPEQALLVAEYALRTAEQQPQVGGDVVDILRRFVAWDKRYPKGSVHHMAGERELDRLFADAKAALQQLVPQVVAAGEVAERQFPVMKTGKFGEPKTWIPWSIAEKAYPAYCNDGGRGQSLERVAERGGFYEGEMDKYYPAWKEEAEITSSRKPKP